MPEKFGDMFSPAQAAFAIRNDSEDQPQQRGRAYDSLVGRRDLPVLDYDPGTAFTVPTSLESKTRAQYFEEQFQYKDSSTSQARERVRKSAPVIAELRTNVIVSAHDSSMRSDLGQY